jgi:PKD repeat protein
MGDGTEKMGRTVQHEYKQPGTYEVTVTAVDGNNLNCSVSEKTYTVEVVKR